MDLSILLEFKYKYQNPLDLQLGCTFYSYFHRVLFHHPSIMVCHVMNLLHQIRPRQGSGP